jgi:hypothetical protein
LNYIRDAVVIIKYHDSMSNMIWPTMKMLLNALMGRDDKTMTSKSAFSIRPALAAISEPIVATSLSWREASAIALSMLMKVVR